MDYNLNVVSDFEEYSLNSISVSRLRDLQIARKDFVLVQMMDHIYALGGANQSDKSLRDVEMFSLGSQKWSKVTEMLISRRQHTAIATKNNIFAFGGFDGVKFLCSVERYDTESKMWM